MQNNKILDKKTALKYLLKHGSPFVHFDGRTEGCKMPPRLIGNPQVVLQFGYNMAVPIPDMKVDNLGVSGTLSFRGVPFFCFVPWNAIFAVVGEDGKGAVFDNVPQEVQQMMDQEKQKKELDSTTENVVEYEDWIQLREAYKGTNTVFKKKNPGPAYRPSFLQVVK